MKSSRSKLKEKLDQVFSEYVRMNYADHRGVTACYTCGTPYHYKKIQAGHFQSRVKMSTRWNEKNVKPQCVRCNIFRAGESWKFGQVLDAEYGAGTAQKLYILSNKMRKYSEAELEAMYEKYKKLRDELARELE